MEDSIGLDSVRTRGVKENGERFFSLQLRGKEIYNLLNLLEDLAIKETAYLEVRAAVYFAEKIREQVKVQGF